MRDILQKSPLTFTKVKWIPLYQLQNYDKNLNQDLNPQTNIVAIEHQVKSWKMTSFLMTSLCQ